MFCFLYGGVHCGCPQWWAVRLLAKALGMTEQPCGSHNWQTVQPTWTRALFFVSELASSRNPADYPSSGFFRSLALSASASATPAVRPTALRGAPAHVTGDPCAVSITSCEPPDIKVEITKPDIEVNRWPALGGSSLRGPPAGSEQKSRAGAGEAGRRRRNTPEERRAEGQVTRDRSGGEGTGADCESNIARRATSSSRRMARWKHPSAVRETGRCYPHVKLCFCIKSARSFSDRGRRREQR